MLPLNSTFTACLFSASIVFTYLLVRLKWVRIPVALLLGLTSNSISFFLFSLASGNSLLHALVVCLVLGVTFSLASIGLGYVFRGRSVNALHNQGTVPPYNVESTKVEGL
jgi:hypothetical protein